MIHAAAPAIAKPGDQRSILHCMTLVPATDLSLKDHLVAVQ